MTPERPARDLVQRALAEITAQLQLQEDTAAGMELRAAPEAAAAPAAKAAPAPGDANAARETAAPALPVEPGQPIGAVRVWRGECQVIYAALHLPALGMDSHQLAAFTPPNSPVPHFTLDAAHHAQTDHRIHFGCDLLPRADLGASLPYLQEVHAPLSSALQSAHALPGITPVSLPPLLRALHSPWQIAVFADPGALPALAAPANTYLRHWLALCQTGLTPQTRAHIAWQNLPQRSRQNRAALYHPQTNRLWTLLTTLLGPTPTEKLRTLLTG
ncbi:MAG: hypothetical protein OXU65_02370, partial [Deltaproteobacteria bacterium]|nr:hypothetical protein [Deltaproteobacteria bacterium]